jgi:hypothetical protein
MAKKDMPQGIKKNDWQTIYLCETLEQAQAVIGYSYLIRVNTSHDAMIIGDADHYIPNRFHGSVAISKADALKYVEDVMGRGMTGKDGAQLALKLYITERHETGRYDYKKHQPKPDRTIRTCWIG